MPHRFTAVPVPVLHLRPPYVRAECANSLLVEPGRLVPGSILLSQVCVAAGDAEELSDWVPRLRRHLPGAPLVLRATECSSRELARVAERATRLHVRAVVADDAPLLETLRPLMTSPSDLAADVVEWLALRQIGLTPAVAHLVSSVFTLVPHHDHVSDLLAATGQSQTGTRGRLRRRGLPAPGRWFHVAWALNVALRLQAEPGTPLFRLALDLGYADHSAICQLLRRVFDLRPGEVRGTVGWEWMLERWLQREQAIKPAAA